MRSTPIFAGILLLGAAFGPAWGQHREQGTPGAATGSKSNQESGQGGVGKDGGRNNDNTGARSRAIEQTSTGQLSVSADQQQKGREALTKANPNRVESVPWTVTAGAAVPRQAELRDLPPEVADALGGFKGAQYVLVRDQLVVVDKEARRIVAIIPGMG